MKKKEWVHVLEVRKLILRLSDLPRVTRLSVKGLGLKLRFSDAKNAFSTTSSYESQPLIFRDCNLEEKYLYYKTDQGWFWGVTPPAWRGQMGWGGNFCMWFVYVTLLYSTLDLMSMTGSKYLKGGYLWFVRQGMTSWRVGIRRMGTAVSRRALKEVEMAELWQRRGIGGLPFGKGWVVSVTGS